MTSMPASRSARAMTFAPRSWPSSPGFAMTTRILPAIAPILCRIFPIGVSDGLFILYAFYSVTDRTDPYEIIGVRRDASLAEIQYLLPPQHADPRAGALREAPARPCGRRLRAAWPPSTARWRRSRPRAAESGSALGSLTSAAPRSRRPPNRRAPPSSSTSRRPSRRRSPRSRRRASRVTEVADEAPPAPVEEPVQAEPEPEPEPEPVQAEPEPEPVAEEPAVRRAAGRARARTRAGAGRGGARRRRAGGGARARAGTRDRSPRLPSSRSPSRRSRSRRPSRNLPQARTPGLSRRSTPRTTSPPSPARTQAEVPPAFARRWSRAPCPPQPRTAVATPAPAPRRERPARETPSASAHSLPRLLGAAR